MDKNTIKKDGILEQYLLGELSEADSLEIERLLKEDAELRAHYRDLEDNFEQMALENAVMPHHRVKEKLMTAISSKASEKKEPIPLKPKKAPNRSFLVAASLAALLFLSSFWFYTQWQREKDRLQIIEGQTSTLKNKIDGLEKRLNDTEEWYAAINTPNVTQLVLKGNAIAPAATAVAYVNHNEKQVILNAEGLPQLDADHDYQLWADVEGVMINMGVIPKNETMVHMEYIDHAESLNITIEPAGGNDHPTVEQLISNVTL
ncbi:anti-sigma factor domain-containing protein [Spongiimicrobium salis]|uniref:anti-sigma factor domain-containing protein n=1 Tax=Spongiimicrobium salis TaxID=1667022 RepID=UPI00374DA9AC